MLIFLYYVLLVLSWIMVLVTLFICVCPFIWEVKSDYKEIVFQHQYDKHKQDTYIRYFFFVAVSLVGAITRWWGDYWWSLIACFNFSVFFHFMFFDYVLNWMRKLKWNYLGVGPHAAWTDIKLASINPYIILVVRIVLFLQSCYFMVTL